ncbi:MAG: sensor histidine kinase N-terminal domain-containing protein [Methylobacteriaceae bacterium]|nr:sensor histidine kinase N-terminal domain-containing protein [Methylobacteriaceae bacterium]
MRARSSLRVELLCWVLVPLVGLLVINALVARRDAEATAGLITDRTLLASARAMAEQITLTDGSLEAIIPPAALEMFASSEQDRVVYRIMSPDGALVAGWAELASPPGPPEGPEPSYFDTKFRSEEMRAVAIAQPVVASGGSRTALVIVGQTLRGRTAMVSDLWLHGFLQQALMVAAAAALALFGLHRGLRPLLRLRNEIVERKPDALAPLGQAQVQTELRPLVEALNDALERVRNQIATHRRFVADASHQLRTPLALLKTQAGVGLREDSIAAKDEALRAIDSAAGTMTRLANQLLTLARAEIGSNVLRKEPVDFGEIARAAVEKLAARAIEKNIDLGFECDGTEVKIMGHLTLLNELVVNLVDNAVRYTPAGGVITMSLDRNGDALHLRIEDNGPGIPAHERERAFERFHRILGSETEGFGLGLAIVKEIVIAHDGSVRLGEPAEGSGLVVDIDLPASPRDQPT